MSDYIERMQIEHKQLRERMGKLQEFISTDEFAALPEHERHDLLTQLDVMLAYSGILSRRLLRATGS